MVKRNRLLAGELVRARRSPICIYAYVTKGSVSSVSRANDTAEDQDLIHVPVDANDHMVQRVARLRSDYDRLSQSLILCPGEKRGYWNESKRVPPQTIVQAAVNDQRAKILMDSGADMSIIDPKIARDIGAEIETSEATNATGVGGITYHTEGKATIKVTLAGHLVYFFTLWVGKLGNTDLILGTDFMRSARIRLDVADESVCMPDEIRIPCEGRRRMIFDAGTQIITPQQTVWLEPGGTHVVDLPIWNRRRLWVRRG